MRTIDPIKMIAGFSVFGAVAGIAILVSLPFTVPETLSTEEIAADGYELCLKTDAPFFEGASARCYNRAALMALAEAPITDSSGAPVSVALSHPTDTTAENVISRNCGVYVDLKREGWYALTSSDQRREGYFIRACGALALMLEARPPEIVHFTDGSPDMADMSGFLSGAPFGLEPLVSEVEGDPVELTLGEAPERNGAGDGEEQSDAQRLSLGDAPGQWRAERGDQIVVMQELALADFDGDGIGEIMVFTRAGPRDGTAVFYAVGLLEKDSPESPLSFRLSDYAS